MTEFLDHLTRTGYTVEPRQDGVWFAGHDELPSMFVVEGTNGLLLRAYFGGVQTALDDSILALLNRVNREAIGARFFADEDDDVVVEAWHSRAYDEDGFAAFLEVWVRDIGLLLEEHRTAERSYDA